MKINDTRHLSCGVTYDTLKQGEVYVDTYGNYVFRTEQEFVVCLDNGVIMNEGSYDNDDEFTPVKARLEIE